MSQPGLPWFLARLEEARRQGRTPDAAWICEGYPDWLPFVQEALEIMHASASPTETLIGGHAAPMTASLLQPTLTGSSRSHAETSAPPSYEILGVLGRGGMGVVYRARQTTLNRTVALKMIVAGSHADPEDQARFLNEAEVVASIQHPGIIQVYDFGTYDGLPYLAMELCPKGSLAQKLAGAPLPVREAADLVANLARAMQAAHDRGVVHRDLKPANVLIARDGSARITDFGLAKRVEADSHLTRTGAFIGTPSYVSPEQARASKQAGPPSDIYALGAILYECLTGRPPFKGATAMETLQQVISEEPVSIRHLQPRVPRDLETICHKALSKEPSQRYHTAAAMAEDLERFLAGEPVHARPVGPIHRGLKWVRRRPAVSALLAAVVLSLLGGITASSRWAYVAQQREKLAQKREREVRQALDASGQIAVLLVSNVLAPVAPPVLNREGLRNEGMSAAEHAAIEGLAELPGAIDRVELIRRILENPSTARKLSWRLRPVLRALIELDLDRRDAVLDLVRPGILDKQADPVDRLVRARIFARLGATDEPTARSAVEILLNALDQDFTQGEQIAALEDLASIATYLSEETSAWLSKRVAELIEKAPPATLETLVLAGHLAAVKLPSRSRMPGQKARMLMQRLTRQAEEETSELTLWHELRAFAIVGDSLSEVEAQRAVRRLVDLAEKRNLPATVEAAADVVRTLISKLHPDQRIDCNTRLAALALRLLPATHDEWLLDGLKHSLTLTLASADATQLTKPFREVLSGKLTAAQLLVLAELFPDSVQRLLGEQASRLAAGYLDALTPEITVAKPSVPRLLLVRAYVEAARYLDEQQKLQRLPFGRTLAQSTEETSQLNVAAQIIAALTVKLPEKPRQSLLDNLNSAIEARLSGDLDPSDVDQLGQALAALGELQPRVVRSFAGRLERQVQRLVSKTESPLQLGMLAQGLGAVAPWLEENSRLSIVDELTDRLEQRIHPNSPVSDLRIMRMAVRAIQPWMKAERFEKLCESFAPVVVRLAAQEIWMNERRELIETLFHPLSVAKLIELLRDPACIGPSEEAALRAINEKLGEKFENVWQMMIWLSREQPKLGLGRRGNE